MGLLPFSFAPTVSNIVVAIVLLFLCILMALELLYAISDWLRSYYSGQPRVATAPMPDPGPGPDVRAQRRHPAREYQ